MTVMQRARHRQVVLQLFLAGLQGGDAASAELIEKVDPRDPGQIRGLARTEPTGVEKLHRHRHPRLAFELALGNMQRAQERFGVGNPERFHERRLRHEAGVGKAWQPIAPFHLSDLVRPLVFKREIERERNSVPRRSDSPACDPRNGPASRENR